MSGNSGRPSHCWAAAALIAGMLLGGFTMVVPSSFAADVSDEDVGVAVLLSDFFRAARTVITVNQDLINDPNLGDKKLTGDVAVGQAVKIMVQETGVDVRKIDAQSRKGRLALAMKSAIDGVMSANQATINQPGVGFKGFVPAIFARLVTERFRAEAAGQAELKFTSRPELIRNRKAAPDPFEVDIIQSKFLSPAWPTGKFYALSTTVNGRPAARVLVPEYYGAGCLSCHGSPRGELDITGYPKEGGALGELGSVFSFILYR
jgi:hypothetical protein